MASFLPPISALSYDHDLPQNISVREANISFTTFAQTMTSDEINPRYSLIGFPSIVGVVEVSMRIFIIKVYYEVYLFELRISREMVCFQVIKNLILLLI